MYARITATAAAFIVALACAGGVGEAHAQPAQRYNWSGIYIGIHGGAAWSDVNWQTTVAGVPSDQSSDATNALLGGQAGFNWQIGTLVIGLEADISKTRAREGATCPNPAFTCFSQLDTLASVRARLGTTALAHHVLLYVTGGWGFADYTFEALPTAGGFHRTKSFEGWSVGAGGEMAIAGHFSLRAEYLAYIFDAAHEAAGNTSATSRPTVNVARIGLNYRF
ncbi:MAG: outer membrane beta-barrel protein [Hyphomicrobiaceae bacterium]